MKTINYVLFVAPILSKLYFSLVDIEQSVENAIKYPKTITTVPNKLKNP